jgi:hypothetical protein
VTAKPEIDLMRITIAEYRSLLDKNQLPEQEDEVLAKAAGITPEALRALPYPEWKRLAQDLFKKAREPLSDPN